MLINCKHPDYTLTLKAKIVASTCVGEILATITNSGIIKKAWMSGKSVDDVKKTKTNGEIPKGSYALRVNAMSNKQAKIMKKIEILISVLGSLSVRHEP